VNDHEGLQHECPMCGEQMRLRHHTRVRQLPGLPERKTIEIVEWECPECDYYEEFEEPSPRQGA
jgi:predicted RNA-binding Zn-ribbon protein involved in translation (DUF1610 family)